MIGGYGSRGASPSIEVLPSSYTTRGSLPSLPSLARDSSYCSGAFTGQSLMTCTTGSAILTPYGWIYRPGQSELIVLRQSSLN